MREGLLLCALFTLIPTVCPAQAKGSTQDEEAIRKVMRQWLESFEKRDATLRNGLLTEGTVFINAFGVEREGRESVSAFWRELFATGTFDQSKLTIRQEKIRFLRPDLAIVDRFEDVTGQRATETGRVLPPRNVHLTFILTRTGAGWLVAYYRAGDLRTDSITR
jgi:uncharacterized protein (TIGR02246 family)